MRPHWKRLLSWLILVPWALPGTVVAVSVAEAYGKPSPLLGSYILVGTFWILPVVYFLRFMPLVVRAVQASMEQIDSALEEAASSLGARWWQRFTRVTLPIVGPSIAGTLWPLYCPGRVCPSGWYLCRKSPDFNAIASELPTSISDGTAYGSFLCNIGFIMIVPRAWKSYVVKQTVSLRRWQYAVGRKEYRKLQLLTAALPPHRR